MIGNDSPSKLVIIQDDSDSNSDSSFDSEGTGYSKTLD